MRGLMTSILRKFVVLGAIAVVISAVSFSDSWAQQTLPREADEWHAANYICRGSSGPKSDAACSRRELLQTQLEKSGWCYGAPGQFAVNRKWQKCQQTPAQNANVRSLATRQSTIPADWQGRFRQLDHLSPEKNDDCEGSVLEVTRDMVSNGDTETEGLTRVDVTNDTLVVRAKFIGNLGEKYAGPVRLVRVGSEIHFFVGKRRFGRYDLTAC
jgi:hypothetical protein